MVITSKDTKLRPGYKQTEAGVIPEDWEIITLKRIVQNNRIPSGIYKEKELNGSGTKIIKLGDVFGGDYFESHNAQRVILSRKELLKNQVFVGDIIISLASVKLEGVGKVMYVNNLEEETAFDHNVALIRTNKDCDSEYIFYYLKSDKIRDVIRQFSTQVGTTFLKSSTIQEFKILLPPTKHEQIAITTTLSDTEALIEHLNKLISKKRDIKQATLQQLLTSKTRLPGFSGEWEVRKLGDVSEIKTGKKNNEDKVESGAYPFFVRSQTVERINTYSFDGEAILVPGEGGIGNIIHYINGKFDYHQRVYKISEFGCDFCGKFVYYCMFLNFNKHASRNSVKATVDSLRLPTFQEFEFLAPSFKEQKAIAAVLTDMDAEISALEQKCDKTRALKQGMMQELLTGKTRLI